MIGAAVLGVLGGGGGGFAFQTGWREELSLVAGASEGASERGNLWKSRFTEKMGSSFWWGLVPTLWEMVDGLAGTTVVLSPATRSGPEGLGFEVLIQGPEGPCSLRMSSGSYQHIGSVESFWHCGQNVGAGEKQPQILRLHWEQRTLPTSLKMTSALYDDKYLMYQAFAVSLNPLA
jgi:hypothetical protein